MLGCCTLLVLAHGCREPFRSNCMALEERITKSLSSNHRRSHCWSRRVSIILDRPLSKVTWWEPRPLARDLGGLTPQVTRRRHTSRGARFTVAGGCILQSIIQMVGCGNRQAMVLFLLPKLSYINLSTLVSEISFCICGIPN